MIRHRRPRGRRARLFLRGSHRCESKSRSGPGAGGGSIAAVSEGPGRLCRHLRARPQGLLGRRSLWASAKVPGPEVRRRPGRASGPGMPRGPRGRLRPRVRRRPQFPAFAGRGGAGSREPWVPACTCGGLQVPACPASRCRPARVLGTASELGGRGASRGGADGCTEGGAGCRLDPPGMAGFGGHSLREGTPADP